MSTNDSPMTLVEQFKLKSELNRKAVIALAAKAKGAFAIKELDLVAELLTEQDRFDRMMVKHLLGGEHGNVNQDS